MAMFCNICASQAIMQSQLDAINQQWDSKKMERDPKRPVKPKLFTWDPETCPHRRKRIEEELTKLVEESEKLGLYE